MPDNSHPFDPFAQASTAGEAPAPTPLNDNVETDPGYFGQMWGYFTHKRLDAVEARVARLEKHHRLQVVGGSDFETEVAHIRRELAQMDVQVAAFFGLPIPDLPEDFWRMR